MLEKLLIVIKNKYMASHHTKMNNEIPAWLYFAISPAGIKNSKLDSELANEIALRVKSKLKEHLKIHCLENDIITEPNNFDSVIPYSGDGKSKK